MDQAVALALLAAGRGSRMAGRTAKPLRLFLGRTLLSRALDAAVAAELAPVVVVVGHEEIAVRAELARHPASRSIEIVHNPEWASGIASSVRAAIEHLELRHEAWAERQHRVGALCVGLADQPLVGSEAYRRLAAAYDDGAHLAVATYAGLRRNPTLIARPLWDEVKQLDGDDGARVIMRRHPELVREVDCTDTGDPADVDTIEELEELEARQS